MTENIIKTLIKLKSDVKCNVGKVISSMTNVGNDFFGNLRLQRKEILTSQSFRPQRTEVN